MKASEIRQKFLDFFTDKIRKHKIIPAVSLVPENDPTTLFTSSGMQSLVPYLKGESHPLGKRLVNSQPCIRLQDIEEVGDTCHTTFFEMLGNWSLGDYFKKEQLAWFLEFLTSPKYLRLPKEKLYVTVFEGTKEVPRDEESFKIWQDLGIAENHIFFYGPEKNWWSRSGTPEEMPAGEIGGPDSEVFYDFGEELQLHKDSPYVAQKCHPNCQCGRFLEIGNSVFMQYEKKANGGLVELPQKNVDFGAGLERLVAATSNNPDIFQIDLFASLIRIIEAESGKKYEGLGGNGEDKGNQKSMRIIADHLRAAVFLINQGVEPSNKAQGYVLRRLLRRSAVKMKQLGGTVNKAEHFLPMVQAVIDSYHETGLFGQTNAQDIKDKIGAEIIKFNKSLDSGLKEFEKLVSMIQYIDTELIPGEKIFYLYESFGFPIELTKELAEEKGFKIDLDGFNKALKSHQELSRTASAGMFKGGLADQSETTIKYHTATHLLHAALRRVLGTHVQQKGSNITSERLRFDFSHPQKPTVEQVEKVEQVVNEKIKENLPVTMEIMDLDKAQKIGALGFFKEKYGDKVKVYKMGSFSVEICAGPHVDFTGVLGRFKIIKEEGISEGIRRLYAKLDS